MASLIQLGSRVSDELEHVN